MPTDRAHKWWLTDHELNAIVVSYGCARNACFLDSTPCVGHGANFCSDKFSARPFLHGLPPSGWKALFPGIRNDHGMKECASLYVWHTIHKLLLFCDISKRFFVWKIHCWRIFFETQFTVFQPWYSSALFEHTASIQLRALLPVLRNYSPFRTWRHIWRSAWMARFPTSLH